MARAGRKRKQGGRERSGRLKRACVNRQEADTLSVAVAARQRHLGVTRKQATDARAGHTMGVLRIRRIITDRQLEASNRYAAAYFKMHRLKGWPRLTPRAAAYAEMLAGTSHVDEPGEDDVRRAVETWDNANRQIVEALGGKAAIAAVQAIRAFTLHQADPDACNERRAASLVAGLDVLVVHWRIV